VELVGREADSDCEFAGTYEVMDRGSVAGGTAVEEKGGWFVGGGMM
jgi:hypothetical protein